MPRELQGVLVVETVTDMNLLNPELLGSSLTILVKDSVGGGIFVYESDTWVPRLLWS